MPTSKAEDRKPTVMRRLVRLAALSLWALTAVSMVFYFLIDLSLDYQQIQNPCAGADCNWLAISTTEAAVLHGWGLSTQFYALLVLGTTLISILVFWIIAILILWRQSHTLIGWAVSLALIVMPLTAIADADNIINNYPQLTTPTLILSILGGSIFALFAMLFPNGKFVPRWSIFLFFIFLILEVFVFSDANFLAANPDSTFSMGVGFPLFLMQITLLVGLQIYRYFWVSSPEEQLQTRWVLFGLILQLIAVPLWGILYGDLVTFPPGLPRLLASVVGWLVVMAFTVALPITILIAIMRYRLWNIDRIIRKTLIYALLTGILLLIFFGSVVILQAIFRITFGGEQNQAVIVGSTLLVASLLNPLRRHLQTLIDRRFYRRKYDREQILARFGHRVNAGAEDSAAIEQLITAALQETIQPAASGVWLASGNRSSAGGEGPPAWQKGLPAAKQPDLSRFTGRNII